MTRAPPHVDAEQSPRAQPRTAAAHPTCVLIATTHVVLALMALATGPARATVLPDWDLARIVEASDVVVSGRVRDVAVVDVEGHLFTHVTIDVDETLLGRMRTSVVVVQQGGARTGRTSVTSRIQGDVTFVAGERVVVALFKRDDGALAVVGLSLGVWTLDDEGTTLAQTITVPLARDDGALVEPPTERVVALEALRALTDAAREKRIGKRARQRPKATTPTRSVVDGGAPDVDAVDDAPATRAPDGGTR